MGFKHESRDFEKFSIPPRSLIREEYFVVSENTSGSGNRRVKVKRVDDPSEVIFEFERQNWLNVCFEPFRCLVDGEWQDYALFSDLNHHNFSVLDLKAGEVIAKHSGLLLDDAYVSSRHPNYIKDKEPGDILFEHFIPNDFYVPDFWDELTEDYVNQKCQSPKSEDDAPWLIEEEALMKLYAGHLALYSGSLYLDQSGAYNLRCIDLSKISEGIVTSDNRFGDLPVSFKDSDKLRDIIEINDDGFIKVPLILFGNIDTGRFHKSDVSWKEE